MIQSKFIVRMIKEVSTKIVNFMTWAGVVVLGVDICHIVKMRLFFQYILLYTQA